MITSCFLSHAICYSAHLECCKPDNMEYLKLGEGKTGQKTAMPAVCTCRY